MEYLDGETLAARLDARAAPSRMARSAAAAADRPTRSRPRTASGSFTAISSRRICGSRSPDTASSFIKLLDFGIAKLLELTDGRSLTATGTVIGTPHFMAPEQCLGQSVDHRADIYAFGVVLYQAFAGKLPFDGRTFAEIVGAEGDRPAAAAERRCARCRARSTT